MHMHTQTRRTRARKQTSIASLLSNVLPLTHSSSQLLLYLSRAYYDSDDLLQAKQVLLKATHQSPTDYKLWFNLALTMQVRAAVHILSVGLKTLVQLQGCCCCN